MLTVFMFWAERYPGVPRWPARTKDAVALGDSLLWRWHGVHRRYPISLNAAKLVLIFMPQDREWEVHTDL